MFQLAEFRLLALTVVLGIAVASVARITFSSAESKGVVTAVRYSDVVRFTIENDRVEILRASARGITRGDRNRIPSPKDGNIPWAKGSL